MAKKKTNGHDHTNKTSVEFREPAKIITKEPPTSDQQIGRGAVVGGEPRHSQKTNHSGLGEAISVKTRESSAKKQSTFIEAPKRSKGRPRVKEGAGRPSLYSEDKANIIVDAVARKLPLAIAADFAMISHNTLHRWLNERPDFEMRVRYARATATGDLLNRVIEDSAGAWKVLKNIQPKHFKDEPTVHIEASGSLVINTGEKEESFDL